MYTGRLFAEALGLRVTPNGHQSKEPRIAPEPLVLPVVAPIVPKLKRV